MKKSFEDSKKKKGGGRREQDFVMQRNSVG